MDLSDRLQARPTDRDALLSKCGSELSFLSAKRK